VEGILPTIDGLDGHQFSLAVKKLADSLGYGSDRSPFVGSGIDYAQSRPYIPGDPVRFIDWRVTARTGKPHVKEYESPRRLPCFLLLDTSASMTVASGPRSKYAIALQLAGGLAFACLDRISPVGVLGVGQTNLRIEPSLSRERVFEWLYRLRRFRYDERTSLGKRLTDLSGTLRCRSLILALSDLHDPEAIPALKLVAQKHDVAVFQFYDPAENGSGGGGLLRAREAESGREFVTRSSHRWTNPEQVAEELRQTGIDHLFLPTDQPFVGRVRQFCKSRNLLGRGTR
jgi:uncharacterized protein (DUF58 family)